MAGSRQRASPTQGPYLLRYHVIDMQGDLDIEVGFEVDSPRAGDDRVRSDVLPAGAYASLTYRGSDVQAIWALLRWSEAEGVVWDTTNTAKGEAFGSRFEAYLTDDRVEPRKKQWHIELAVRIAEGSTPSR